MYPNTMSKAKEKNKRCEVTMLKTITDCQDKLHNQNIMTSHTFHYVKANDEEVRKER